MTKASIAPQQSTGIIVRTRPLTESSLIIHWLTPDYGRIATVAKGARRPKSPFRGCLDLFFECEMAFLRHRRSELHTLVEVKISKTHPLLRRHLHLLEQVSFWVRILEKSTETESPVPEIYESFSNYLLALSNLELGNAAFCLNAIAFLEIMGIAPDWKKCFTGSDPRSQVISQLRNKGWAQIEMAATSPEPTASLATWLASFLERQFGPLKKPRFHSP